MMSKARLDALSDGIFAVAMTLLVIDLKVPGAADLQSDLELLSVLVQLIPKMVGWIISFLVLAFFWWGNARALHYVKQVDGRLVTLNMLLLALVSFMPFASSLTGEVPQLVGGQVVYGGTMFLMAGVALAEWRYLYRHPELCDPPMPKGAYLESRVRTGMLMVISVLSVVMAMVVPTGGNAAFALMFVANRMGRRARDKSERAA